MADWQSAAERAYEEVATRLAFARPWDVFAAGYAAAEAASQCPATLDGMRCESYTGHPEHAHFDEGTLAMLYEDVNKGLTRIAELGAALREIDERIGSQAHGSGGAVGRIIRAVLAEQENPNG